MRNSEVWAVVNKDEATIYGYYSTRELAEHATTLIEETRLVKTEIAKYLKSSANILTYGHLDLIINKVI